MSNLALVSQTSHFNVTKIALQSTQCFDTLMIFVGVRYSFRAGFSMGVENFYIEKGSAESTSPESICLDARLDIKANGLWGGRFSRTFFDVKIFKPQAKSCPKTISDA